MRLLYKARDEEFSGAGARSISDRKLQSAKGIIDGFVLGGPRSGGGKTESTLKNGGGFKGKTRKCLGKFKGMEGRNKLQEDEFGGALAWACVWVC